MGPVHSGRLRGRTPVTSTGANRRMRENRMSGGVGGVTGAIPSPRPDRCPRKCNLSGVINFACFDEEFLDDFDWDDLFGADPYQSCLDELRTITGGSVRARRALERGDVRVTSIPSDLWRMVEFAAGKRCKIISGEGTYCIRGGAVTTFY